MRRVPLGDTLFALVDAVDAPAGMGITVTDIDMTVPLEASAFVRDGELIICATAPHTRWISGVLPPVHMSHLHIVTEPGGAPE